ncbi:tyrosine-type recombinase/integrase [Geminocystis sp. GBBB08]|uniref:tyrosine-type recombinase/integrase n=1 Tax=Geminocystis sp. GBBB08 TaxID=2604140 RepID=UPI0027E29911|nr:tyrosine-type recombinase/integrase [Geminocystis sp. GBBB08]MBL1210675.1 tyrosine-type recombinase/integrase [Geminocystis sp. GBBB08]
MNSTFRPENCLVSISDNNGSVRLRFTFQGLRQNLNLGIPYNSSNLSLAIATAYQIDHDLKHDSFVSKDQYKVKKCKVSVGIVESLSPSQATTIPKVISSNFQWDLKDIFHLYCEQHTHPDSEVLKICDTLWDWFYRSPHELLKLENADQWVRFLRCEITHKNTSKKGYSDKTIGTALRILKASINFGMELGKISHNPFTALYKSLDTDISKDIRGYNPEQIQGIITAFRDDIYCSKNSPYKHSRYADFIELRFLTGCRPSEAIALRGSDIITRNNRTYIQFNKRYVKGVLKQGLKNKRLSRLFPCNESLSALIHRLPSQLCGELLFTGVRGGYINSDTVNRRYWHPVIEGMVKDGLLPFTIPFYDQRHSFGSLICRKTSDIKTVASLMGNSPNTLYRYYLADDVDFIVPEF